MDTPYISTESAAERLGCSQRYVQHLIATNALPSLRVGKVYLVRPEDVDALPPPDPAKGGWKRGKPRDAKRVAPPQKKLRKKLR